MQACYNNMNDKIFFFFKVFSQQYVIPIIVYNRSGLYYTEYLISLQPVDEK